MQMNSGNGVSVKKIVEKFNLKVLNPEVDIIIIKVYLLKSII